MYRMAARVTNFVERIQVAIDFSGLNGPQLRQAMADAGCELSKNHCYKLMRGEIEDPRYTTLAALIAATGVPSSWFFDPEISETATPSSLEQYIERERSSSAVPRAYGSRG